MKTEIMKVTRDSDAAFVKAAQILREGGLVAFPTETVYGLGANALDEAASAKIYAAKGRPSDNPLIVHIADFSQLGLLTEEIPLKARALADRFWPGPLTMIFHKTDRVPLGTTGGLTTVAVRMPDHFAALQLIREAGVPVAAPSANTSGRPSPTLAAHVAEDMDGRIALILDGGPADIGIESTILDMTQEPPMILRPGRITPAMLEEAIGPVQVDAGVLDGQEAARPKAPGMKYRHYAPKAQMTIVEGEPCRVQEKICQLIRESRGAGLRVGVLCTEETKEDYLDAWAESLGTRGDGVSIAHDLYRALRDFDGQGVDVIYSEGFADTDMGQAIMNRLLKAAGHHVIKA